MQKLWGLCTALVFTLMLGLAPSEPFAQAAPAPQSQPTTTPAASISAPAGDDWPRIQASGKLTAGTAADYVPFSFFTANFMLDGYDISLMRAIGQRLNLQVEFRALPFDTLLGAVAAGEIDVAIAAISISPERSQLVDFTRPYYVGEDALLARQEAAIEQIRTPAEMADLRIGVQAGSVYERWVQTTLIDSKLMPAGQLQIYPDIRRALFELKNNTVDLLILDALPAQDFVRQGGVKIVGGNLSPQSFALAVRKGNTTLIRQLDQTLGQLQDDRYLTKLAGQYLALKPAQVLPIPTTTPIPGATATPPPQLITGFFSDADVVAVGSCVTLRWTTNSAATSLRLFRNGLLVDAGLAGQQYLDCVAVSGPVEYRLEANNGAATQSAKAFVTFVSEQPL